MNEFNECKTEWCINCSVENCIYHKENDTCSAGSISVGNCTANCTSETCCDTFKSKI